MSAVSDQKAINLWTIWMTALTVVLLWAAYLVRDVLLLIYMSGLLAVGFSPIVRLIERQRFLPIGTRRFPRWLAILVLYLFIIGAVVGIGFLVVPPLVHQAQQLWGALPQMFERAQEFLVQKGLLRERLTIQEAVERAPVSKGGDAVTTVFGALAGVVGGLFGFLTILILTFYLLVEADHVACVAAAALCAGAARARGRHESRHHAEGQRLARRSAVSRRHYRIELRSRSVADRRAFLLRAGAHLRSRRAHSCRGPHPFGDSGGRWSPPPCR